MQPSTAADSERPHLPGAAPKWHWPLAAVTEFAKRPKHARSHRTHKVRDGAALALVGVLTLSGVGAATAANQITGNIASIDAEAVFDYFSRETNHERPTVVIPPETVGANQPLNILLLGVDGRFDDNALYAGDDIEGVRSDTTVVMHISADREHVAAISIPRDSIVNIPSCPTTTAGLNTRPATNVRFNSAFATGYDLGGDVQSGALCTMTAIESLTNVRLDGFVVFDFDGFKNMIEALGGLDLCFPDRIDAPKAGGLVIEAGCHNLSGWQALQLARARTGEGLGDGSDLMRIGRQQEIMLGIANQALRKNLLTDAPLLLRFLNVTTRSLTASQNFATVTGLAGLGGSLGGINPENIDFIMVPIADNPDNWATVIWTRAADELWRNVRYNTLWEDSATDADGQLGTAAAPTDS